MYHYIPPCLGTDVPAVAVSRSLCILPKGCVGRMSWSSILAQGMRLGLIGIGKAGRSARIEPKPRARLVWSGLVLMDAWVPHPIPNCKKTKLRHGYRACQSIGICIVTPITSQHAHATCNSLFFSTPCPLTACQNSKQKL